MNTDTTVTIVIPSYNEREAIEETVRKITGMLEIPGIKGRLLVVDDDSPDRTWEFCETLSTQYPMEVIRRIGKRGLSSAVIEGWESSDSDILGVMDADGSHDERVLPQMLSAVKDDKCQLAIGSRYIKGGGTEGWPISRQIISRFAKTLAFPVASLKDATSGFCLFRRNVIEGVALDPVGWKIVLEVFVKGNYNTYMEFPIIFKDRQHGKSKLGKNAVLNYLEHLGKLNRWMKENRKKRR